MLFFLQCSCSCCTVTDMHHVAVQSAECFLPLLFPHPCAECVYLGMFLYLSEDQMSSQG